MRRTDRFQSLAEVRLERERLRGIRDHHQDALLEYWDLVREPAFRRGMAGDAFGDMLRAWKPLRSLSQLLRVENGAVGSAIGLAMGARSKTVKGRVIGWIVSAIAPMLLERFATPEKLEHLVTELKRSWERVKDRFRDGNA
ncbi:MAG: hypothetical protein H6592_13365 [Flavobacteriales bacterium]|nr:hypothetical protein [Flavobacteriales bacterium]HPF91320.1 hypothetical protein [Flavobacteriales bacterium]